MTFHWFTNDDQILRPDQMDTLHLFHTVKLLWNHTVDEKHQIKPFRQWNLTLDADEREEAMTEMLAELGRRLDKAALTPNQQIELQVIRAGSAVYNRGLNELPLFDPCDEGDYDEDEEQWARDELSDMGDR